MAEILCERDTNFNATALEHFVSCQMRLTSLEVTDDTDWCSGCTVHILFNSHFGKCSINFTHI